MSNGKKVFIGLNIDLQTLKLEVKINGFVGSKGRWLIIPIGKGKPLTQYATF